MNLSLITTAKPNNPGCFLMSSWNPPKNPNQRHSRISSLIPPRPLAYAATRIHPGKPLRGMTSIAIRRYDDEHVSPFTGPISPTITQKGANRYETRLDFPLLHCGHSRLCG